MPEVKNVFQDFTNLYELSKTLRFELKPVPETEKILELNAAKTKKFPKDLYRAENFEIIKKYTDELHRTYIRETLNNVNIDYLKFLEIFRINGKKKNEMTDENEESDENNEKDDIQKIKKELRSKIGNLFNKWNNDKDNKFKDWVKIDVGKKEKEVSGDLFGKELITILKNYFKNKLDSKVNVPMLFFNEQEIKNGEAKKQRKLEAVFENFDKFTTYFTDSFYNNRKNYYKTEGRVGQVATRIIDENLPRFCSNLIAFNEVVSLYSTLLNNFDLGWKEYLNEKKINQTWVEKFELSNYDWKALFNDVNYYNQCLLQEGIDKYNYIIKKLNKDINEYTQNKYKSVEKGNNNNPDINFFQKLHKQIHGERDFKLIEIDIDENNIFTKILPEFILHSDMKLMTKIDEEVGVEEIVGAERIIKIFIKQELKDLEKIYLSRRAIETISAKWFHSWETLKDLILGYLNKDLLESKKRKKVPDFVDFNIIKIVLENNKDDYKDLFKRKYFEADKNEFVDWIDSSGGTKKLEFGGENWINFLNVFEYEFGTLLTEYKKNKNALLYLIDKKIDYDKNNEVGQTAAIKNFADSALGIFRMVSYFALRKKGVMVEPKNGKDEIFYAFVDRYLDGDDNDREEQNKIVQYYNTLRNFVTQKAWSIDKVRLCFDCGEFLKGWDKDKIHERLGIILRNNNKFYLGILNKNHKQIFIKIKSHDNNNFYYVIYDYKQLNNVYRQIPRLAFPSRSVKKGDAYMLRAIQERKKKFFLEDEEFIELQEIKNEYDKIGNDLSKEKLTKLIEYYKKVVISNYSSLYNVSNLNNKKFNSINEFNQYVENLMYSLIPTRISPDFIKEKISKGELYLFQIYNKDFELDESIGKEKFGEDFAPVIMDGKNNLHTEYFKLLFNDSNLKNPNGVVFKLSGGAKMFYRPATENLPIKKDRDGNIIKNKKGENVIVGQRYKEDKYFLHLPIILNFVNKGKNYSINDMVNKAITNASDDQDKFRIIGLDRGEKHLVYYSVINERQEIIEIGSLNNISRKDNKGEIIEEKNWYHDKFGNIEKEPTKEYHKDYHNLLDQREIERLKSRQSWEKIENIKELKEGYISAVINKICNLVIKAIKENKIPIVALENLNSGMKRGRIKIDKQIYQKLELKLAKKLNFLVDKKEKNYLSAWQFTPKIETFSGDIEKKNQVGIIFYVDPAFTSATCPNCGFRKRIKMDPQNAKKKIKDMEITYENGIYKFDYPIENGENDVVYSDVERLKWDNEKKKVIKTKNVSDDFGKLFEDIKDKNNLKKELLSIGEENKEFWKEFSRCFNLLLRIRNSKLIKRKLNDDTGKVEIIADDDLADRDRDFIYCPQCHFHSEGGDVFGEFVKKKYLGKDNFEFNGDANGAYNIARKTIIAVNKIKDYQLGLNHFIEKYRISELPNNGKDKKNIFYNNNSYILSFFEVQDEKFRKVKVYGLKKDGDRQIIQKKEMWYRRYPDIFVNNKEWDKFVQNKS